MLVVLRISQSIANKKYYLASIVSKAFRENQDYIQFATNYAFEYVSDIGDDLKDKVGQSCKELR